MCSYLTSTTRSGRSGTNDRSLVAFHAAHRARQPLPLVRLGARPLLPRVLVAVAEQQRLQLADQLGPPRRGECTDHPDVLQLAVGVEPEQQRADQRLVVGRGLVPPKAGEHAVGGALVLDLEHHPLVLLVDAVERLGDHAVEAGALELGEPALRLVRSRSWRA